MHQLVLKRQPIHHNKDETKLTMNNRLQHHLAHSFGVLLAAATLTGSHSLSAADPETLLPSPDFASGARGNSALIDPFSADPANPGVFIGSTVDASGNGALVRLDPNGTSSYTVTNVDSELFAVSDLGCNTPPFSPVSPTRLYAVGSRRAFTVPPLPRTNPYLWVVRTSADGGDSWTGIGGDTFQLNSRESAGANGFAADASGNVYACGNAFLKNLTHWIVRRLSAGGANWQTVSDLTAKSGGYANGMCFFPGNNLNSVPAVFAVGWLNSKWEVRRSQDHGLTWLSVDPGVGLGNAHKAACDSAGNIFVVGSRDSGSRWVVRMSADGGTTWATMLDVADGSINAARNVAADQQGNVWVAGMTSVGSDASAPRRWTVVRHNNILSTPESWSDSWSSRQHSFPGDYSDAFGIAADATGNNVFVTGTVQDWTDGNLNFYPGSRLAVQRLQP